MSKDIIQRIGETDQLYLEENSAELASERADLRLQLVTLSRNKQEQIHFLHEAIVLLEQARIEFEDQSTANYIDLSLQLVKAYMIYYELSQDQKFALITQQILKPLAHFQDGNIYFYLAYASAVKDETAMTRHWLIKYADTDCFDLHLLKQHHAFRLQQKERWFTDILNKKLN